MLPIYRKLKLIIKGLLLSFFIWLLLVIIQSNWRFLYELNETIDQFFYYKFFKPYVSEANNQNNLDDQEPIVIIDVGFTLNRSLDDYASLVKYFDERRAACIGFDINFSDDFADERDGKNELVAAVKKYEFVVLPLNFIVSGHPPKLQSNISKQLNSKDSRFDCEEKDYSRKFYADSVIAPFEELLDATRFVGHVNFRPNMFHLFPLIIKLEHDSYKELYFPPISFELARLYLFRVKNSELRISDIPTAEYCQVFTNFLPTESFVTFNNKVSSLNDLIRILEESDINFRDKIILIVNEKSEFDNRLEGKSIPLRGGTYPRWAMLASLASQFINNENIAKPLIGPFKVVFWILLVTMIWILLLSERFSRRVRRLRWALLSGIFLIFLTSFLLLQFNYWTGVIKPVILYLGVLPFLVKDIRKLYQETSYIDLNITVKKAREHLYSVSVSHAAYGEEMGNETFDNFFENDEFKYLNEKLNFINIESDELRKFGALLYNNLLQGTVQKQFEQYYMFAQSERKRLRLQLRIDAAEVSHLPWEYLYNDNFDTGFLVLNKDISLSRYVALDSFFFKQKEFRAPLRILLAIASPSDQALLDVESEKKMIKKALRANLVFRQINVKVCEHVTLDGLSNEIEKGKYDVLHFIGHGAFDEEKNEGLLIMEDKYHQSRFVDAGTLGILLNKSTIRLAILNSCEGAVARGANIFYGVAQKLIKAGLPSVIAMQHEIVDEIAVLFSRTFYSSFVLHFSVDRALSDARLAILKHVGLEHPDWGTPVLFQRPQLPSLTNSEIEF